MATYPMGFGWIKSKSAAVPAELSEFATPVSLPEIHLILKHVSKTNVLRVIAPFCWKPSNTKHIFFLPSVRNCLYQSLIDVWDAKNCPVPVPQPFGVHFFRP